MDKIHRQRSAEIHVKVDQIKAVMAEARAQHVQQVKAKRLERRLETREQEQRAKDNERAQKLTEAIAARERRRKARRES